MSSASIWDIVDLPENVDTEPRASVCLERTEADPNSPKKACNPAK
jgi:hypothetical protein